MDISTAIAAGKSLWHLGQEIATVVKKAQESPDVTKRVLLYLESVQAAVSALGLERQQILTDVRGCDVRDSDQVSMVWMRLDRYLYEDNIRPQLEKSISGLTACRQAIVNETKGLRWRKRNKKAAVNAFNSTLSELESTLTGLASNFYPGGSGMGVQTLVPIYELLSTVREHRKSQKPDASEIESLEEQLGDLAREALRDESHEEWFRMTGKVETLLAELQLAFSVAVA